LDHGNARYCRCIQGGKPDHHAQRGTGRLRWSRNGSRQGPVSIHRAIPGSLLQGSGGRGDSLAVLSASGAGFSFVRRNFLKRTGSIPFMGLKIGIFVFIACALLLWATFQSGSFRFGKEEEITILFPSVGGLEEGAVVRLNGVPIGVVRDISLAPSGNEVSVKLGVKRGTRARLHQGASARITPVGFLAELYVELSGGNDLAPPIQNDSQITPGLLADP